MKDTKNKEDKKEKESQELKEELTEDELMGLSGGGYTDPREEMEEKMIQERLSDPLTGKE